MPSRPCLTCLSTRLQALECPGSPKTVRFDPWPWIFVKDPLLAFIDLTRLTCSDVLYSRRTLSNRDLLFFRHGGNEKELEALFNFLAETGQECHLESLSLTERAPVSLKSLNHIITQLQSPSFSRLSSLQVSCPQLPGLRGLTSLTKLAIEFILFESTFYHDLNLASYDWALPRSGSLTELDVHFEDRLETRPYHMESRHYIRMPMEPNGPLRNLRVLRLQTNFFEHVLSVDFATMSPELEELEMSGRGNHHKAFADLTIPSSLKKLVFTVAYCWECFDFPINFSVLTNLIDLTVLHQCGRRHRPVPRGWGDVPFDEVPWPLDPLLSLPPSLERLRIVSADRMNKWDKQYETFLVQLATLKEPRPNFQLLDLTSIPMTLQVATMLKQAYHQAEVLHRLREYQSPRPLRSDELPHDYYAALLVGRSAPLSPDDGIYHHMPTGLGELRSCTLCGIMVGENVMEEHKSEVCAKRSIRCVLRDLGCNFVGSVSDFRNHKRVCAFYEVKCLECLATMPLSEYDEHSSKHDEILNEVQLEYLARPAFRSMRSYTCFGCNEEMPSIDSINKHACEKSTPSKVLLSAAIPARKKSLTPLDQCTHTSGDN